LLSGYKDVEIEEGIARDWTATSRERAWRVLFYGWAIRVRVWTYSCSQQIHSRFI